MNLLEDISEDCRKCGLYEGARNPFMRYTGKGKKEILIVGEAPGAVEDEKDVQFVGRSGQILREALEDLDIEMEEDCWKTNAVRCRPPENKTPTGRQISLCRYYLLKETKILRPKLIFLFGKVAFEGLLGYRISGRINGLSFGNWVGEIIPDQELKAWVCPVWHPAYIMRNEKDEVLKKLWMKYIRKALMFLDSVEFPDYSDIDKRIEIVTDPRRIVSVLIKILKGENGKEWAFDYETTGLSPYREGHRILFASISNGKRAFGFPFFENETFLKLWKKFLMSEEIGKIAHNARFEKLWSKKILDIEVKNWKWDTMIVQHCVQNTKAVGLKYLVYKDFGILGYDDYSEKFIKGKDPKDTSSFNKLDKADSEKISRYCAQDSLFTFWEYLKQKKFFSKKERENLLKGVEFFLKGNIVLSDISYNGIRINENKLKIQRDKLVKRLNRIGEDILSSSEAQRWKKNKKTEINFRSNQQLSELLYGILGIKAENYTSRGNFSTSKNVLADLNTDFTRKILEYRKWDKLKNYLEQFSREIKDGFIHPVFRLENVATFRSSSSNPNFQNIPKRDEKIKRIVRSLLIPREGNKLVEYDYKSMEVNVSACYNKDPELIRYIENPSSDLHRDMAKELFLKDDVTKEERYLAKNGFVFPEFYGSWYGNLYEDIWKRLPDGTREHLEKEGIKNVEDFEDHLEMVEYRFWNEKFRVFKEWREEILSSYKKKGYLDMYTGFRCYGPMRKNEVINYLIQGSAFHCLLWTLIQVSRKMKKMDKSYIIGQIHDSIVMDVCPEDEEEIDYWIWYYGTKKIREHWDWIIVPLTIEKEYSEINGNWGNMKDGGCLKGRNAQ